MRLTLKCQLGVIKLPNLKAEGSDWNEKVDKTRKVEIEVGVAVIA